MRDSIVLFISLLLLHCGTVDAFKDKTRKKPAPDNTLSILCTPDLYDLTTRWANEFCHLNPEVKMEVVNTEKSSFAGDLNMEGKLGFISGTYPGIFDKSVWNLVIGRDVIVPVFNASNPFADEISLQGITPEGFAEILSNPEMKHWGTLIDNQRKESVNLYLTDDESINSGMAKFLGLDQITIDGTKVGNGEALMSSVQKDPFAIGLCKITTITDLNGQGMAENIKLLPIDRNGNGKIDFMEKIYDDLDILSRGIWIGKYPKALINNLYFVSPVKPTNEAEIAFIRWTLTGGQQFLDQYGYSGLLLSERNTKSGLFNDQHFTIITPDENYAASRWALFILGSFVAVVIMLITVNLQRMNKIIYKNADHSDRAYVPTKVLNEDLVESPMGLYYDKAHTWAFMEKDGLVRIGIDDFLQHVTGTLTRIKMKGTGEMIRKGKPILSIIQNGKLLNIPSPISGTIKAQNKDLAKRSALINSSPYSDGWVYRIEPANWIKEIQFLITGTRYKEWLKGEFSRIKDFLAASVKPNLEYAHVLQDGGELKDGILADLGPEVWEDFQTNFIDVSI